MSDPIFFQVQGKKTYYEFVSFETRNIKESWNDHTSVIGLRIINAIGSFFKSLGTYLWTNGGRGFLNIGVGFKNLWMRILPREISPEPRLELGDPQHELVPVQAKVEAENDPQNDFSGVEEREKSIESPKLQTNSLVDGVTHFPVAAVGAATLAGIASRFVDKLPSDMSQLQALLDLKDRAACRAGFSSGILQGINNFKQWEIKNVSLLTPLIPIMVKITADALSNKEPNQGILGLAKKFVQATKNQVTLKEAVFLATIITLSLLNPLYGKALCLTTTTFDSSGHLMLKGSLALFLSRTLQMIQANSGKTLARLASAFGVLYGLSDFVFLYNTSAICHTATELLAGIGWAAGIYSIGSAAAALVNRGASKAQP